MSKNYGVMIGCASALAWVENLKGVDENIKMRVLNRMKYEFDKDIPVPYTFHKGKYGKKYDYMTCGNCGAGINVTYDYCPKCAFAIDKNRRRDPDGNEIR